jgi:hypothetical protein
MDEIDRVFQRRYKPPNPFPPGCASHLELGPRNINASREKGGPMDIMRAMEVLDPVP